MTAAALPLDWIRKRFPALSSETCFLDNAAGAQVPRDTVERVTWALTSAQVNTGGHYAESMAIDGVKEDVRRKIADFVNAPGPEHISFGPNATTLITLLAYAFRRTLKAGDEIVVTGFDHHANVDPWRALSEVGVEIKVWSPREPDFRLHVEDLEPLLGERTRLVAMSAASNALGTYTPVADAAARVHDAGALLFVDAVHYSPHRMPDVRAWNVDGLVFSPYKVFGPHLGALYLGEALRALPSPRLSFFESPDPHDWEPGTPNHECIAGFGGTFDYLDALAAEIGASPGREGWRQVYAAFEAHERGLCQKLFDGLDDLGATVYGVLDPTQRTATVAANLGDHTADAVAEHLGRDRIAVSAGHYYAYDLVMKHMGLAERGGMVRISALHYNNDEDIDRVLASLARLDQ